MSEGGEAVSREDKWYKDGPRCSLGPAGPVNLLRKTEPIARWFLRWNSVWDHSCALMDCICGTACPSGVEPKATGGASGALYAFSK